MLIETFESGPYQTNGYIVADERSARAVIIDVPLDAAAPMRAWLRERDCAATAIVLTHGHFDHVGEVRALSEQLGVRVFIHEGDVAMLREPMAAFAGLDVRVEGMEARALLAHGQTVECGALRLEVLHVPGHTPGHIALYEAAQGRLFCGDVLFYGSIGRTDLPGGDYQTLMTSITELLLTLPDDTIVYSGHGPTTSIGYERLHNPFILDYLDHF